jgi:hypothetical protein
VLLTFGGALPSWMEVAGVRSDFVVTSAGSPDVLDQVTSYPMLLNCNLFQADEQHGIQPLN